MDELELKTKEWIEAMQRGDIDKLPKGGILLIGAPGTGKTIYAEVVAHELGLPFLEILNTRDPYVGISERNEELWQDTVRALAPVVVFIDEIDQQILPRGSVYHGDSGVSSNSNRKMMQFLSDPTIHGRVLFIAATNRPDLIDSAVGREGRFAVKIPFLIPNLDGRPSIWKALLHKEQIRLGLMGIDFESSNIINDEKLLRELSLMVDFWDSETEGLMYGPPPEGKDTVPLTGAEMEGIIGIALQMSSGGAIGKKDVKRSRHCSKKTAVITGEMLKEAIRNYLPHQDGADSYQEMNDAALRSCNNLLLVPPAYHKRARQLRSGYKKPKKTFLP
jgi:SpoVK/Ycf46/Vps4 family AAA+-type ATPase